MPIHVLSATRDALSPGFSGCESRSLWSSRFVFFDDAGDTKERNLVLQSKWFDRLFELQPGPTPSFAWLPSDHSTQLHAQLQSRLLINLAGSVMENAGVSLDRFGHPIIPSSAVKGCARRMALQALHDWIEAQIEKGSTERPAEDDACAPCCKDFTTPAEMLAAIARIFGWTPADWKASEKSDFAWASGGGLQPPSLDHIERIFAEAKKILTPFHETFAGTVAFLAASPNCDPRLELDVITPHHTEYHKGTPGYESAPDTEDPIPVFFPAVKPQIGTDHFTFPLIRLRLAKTGDLAAAKLWLSHGLELFGIGAKTNAGYGWFMPLERLEASVEEFQILLEKTRQLATAAALKAEKIKRDEESAASALRENEIADLLAARAEELAPLRAIQATPALLERFTAMKPDQIRGVINAFSYPRSIWPKAPAEEADASFQVSLFVFLTETDRTLLDQEAAKPKSKVVTALKQLAEAYGRPEPA